jgi:hypothetical protein
MIIYKQVAWQSVMTSVVLLLDKEKHFKRQLNH